MEQEPESPILYDTIKRVGYSLALVTHAIFITIALIGAVILLAALLISSTSN